MRGRARALQSGTHGRIYPNVCVCVCVCIICVYVHVYVCVYVCMYLRMYVVCMCNTHTYMEVGREESKDLWGYLRAH